MRRCAKTGPRGLLLERGSVLHLQIALHDHFLLPTHSSQAAQCAKDEKSAITEGFSPPNGPAQDPIHPLSNAPPFFSPTSLSMALF